MNALLVRLTLLASIFFVSALNSSALVQERSVAKIGGPIADALRELV